MQYKTHLFVINISNLSYILDHPRFMYTTRHNRKIWISKIIIKIKLCVCICVCVCVCECMPTNINTYSLKKYACKYTYVPEYVCMYVCVKKSLTRD